MQHFLLAFRGKCRFSVRRRTFTFFSETRNTFPQVKIMSSSLPSPASSSPVDWSVDRLHFLWMKAAEHCSLPQSKSNPQQKEPKELSNLLVFLNQLNADIRFRQTRGMSSFISTNISSWQHVTAQDNLAVVRTTYGLIECLRVCYISSFFFLLHFLFTSFLLHRLICTWRQQLSLLSSPISPQGFEEEESE